MPTWRDWGIKDSFLDSTFYKYVSSLIINSSLTELLEKENVILKFYLHKNMKDFLSFFESKGPKIKLIEFAQESVQKMIKESNLLITDYSSVSWDFFYLDKPVIFYQFDYEDYLIHRGSYLDLEKDIFGDRANSIQSLIDSLQYYIDNNFQEKEKFKLIKPNFFKYSDKFNCTRIYHEIMRL